MATQREIIVRLRAEIADYQKAMAAAAKSTDALGKQNQKTSKDATASAEQTRAAWTTTGTALLAVGAAILGVGAAAAKTGIDYNTLQQTSRAALKTLLGSAEAANAQMDKLDAFARTSPFSKAVFITAQQQLIGFGMAAKDVLPTLDAIQNAVAATGGSNQDIAELTRIIAQVGATGKITAEDLNQFGQRGVDAATLIGSQMGKTGAQIREEITKGTLGADDAVKALVAGMDQRFAGSAANVKATFVGATDRVKAAWRDLSGDLMAPMVGPNGGGFLIDIANGAADTMRAFQTLPGPVKIAAESLGGLTGVAALLGGGFMVVKPKIDAFNAALGVMNVSVKAVWSTLGIATAVLAVAGFALGLYAKNQADAKARVDDYKTSLDQATQAITTNTRAIAFNNLKSDGAIDAAKRLGLNLNDVVTASLYPMSNAYDRVAAGVKRWQDAQAAIRASMGTDRASQEAAGQSILKLDAANADLALVLKSVGLQQVAVAGAQSNLSDELAAGVGVTDSATGSQGALAGATEATAEEMKAAEKAFSDWVKATSDADSSFIGLDNAYQGVIDKNTELATNTADKTKSSKDSWQTYYDGVSVSAGDYIKQLQDQVTAQQNWETNILAITDRVKVGMTGKMAEAATGMIDELLQLGPKGAAQVALLKSMSDEQFTQVVTLWSQKGTAAVSQFVTKVEAYRQPVITPVVNPNPAQAAVDRWEARLAAREPVITPGVDTSRAQASLNAWLNANANHQIHVAVGAGGSGGITRASGGLITGPGTGTSDSIHALVSNGEYIVKADAVQHYGPGYFDSLNAKRFASGGYAGTGSVAGGSQSAPAIYVQNPFTGEYLLAQVAGVAGGVVAQAQASRTLAMSGGSR